MATPALAYVDPSVMTYTIQALAAVAVALSAVLGVASTRPGRPRPTPRRGRRSLPLVASCAAAPSRATQACLGDAA